MGQSIVRIVNALHIIGMALTVPLLAEEITIDSGAKIGNRFSYGAENALHSRYIWHGLAWSEGWVSQPTAWISHSGVTLTLFSNFDFNRSLTRDSYNELDIILSYEKTLGRLTLGQLINYYTYPHQKTAPETGELSTKLSYRISSFTIYTIQTFDYAKFRGGYFGELGMSFSRGLAPRLELEPVVSLGWGSKKFNEAYVGPSVNALEVAQVVLTLTWRPTMKLYLKPHIEFYSVIDSLIRNAVHEPDVLVGAVTFGVEM